MITHMKKKYQKKETKVIRIGKKTKLTKIIYYLTDHWINVRVEVCKLSSSDVMEFRLVMGDGVILAKKILQSVILESPNEKMRKETINTLIDKGMEFLKHSASLTLEDSYRRMGKVL
jgi:hypothetical protein